MLGGIVSQLLRFFCSATDSVWLSRSFGGVVGSFVVWFLAGGLRCLYSSSCHSRASLSMRCMADSMTSQEALSLSAVWIFSLGVFSAYSFLVFMTSVVHESCRLLSEPSSNIISVSGTGPLVLVGGQRKMTGASNSTSKRSSSQEKRRLLVKAQRPMTFSLHWE